MKIPKKHQLVLSGTSLVFGYIFAIVLAVILLILAPPTFEFIFAFAGGEAENVPALVVMWLVLTGVETWIVNLLWYSQYR